MFEKGDNQISTRKIHGGVAGRHLCAGRAAALEPDRRQQGYKTGGFRQPTSAGIGSRRPTASGTVPNLVGLRYTTDIKGNSALYRLPHRHGGAGAQPTVPQGVVISQDRRRAGKLVRNRTHHPDHESAAARCLWRCRTSSALRRPTPAKSWTHWASNKMVMVDNDGRWPRGCVAKTDYKAGTKINTENVTCISSGHATMRAVDRHAGGPTGNAGESTPEPSTRSRKSE